jgi:hypothetical protein
MPERVSEPPPPSPNPTGMPRYLRTTPRPTREQVIQSLDEMTWEERQEELRIPRIYPRAGKPNQIPYERSY